MSIPTPALDALRDTLSDDFKDTRLNLSSVLSGEYLEPARGLGVALAAARFVRAGKLVTALEADIRDSLADTAVAVISDATAAAGLMAMNTVYYRFRHMIEKDAYQSRPARLRMMRMGQPATDKQTFELMSLACAALAGCQQCLQSHEASLLKLSVSEDSCHDAVRIAAVINAAAVGTA